MVFELLKSTINEKRTDQNYVLLEGLCNSAKLASEDDKLETRLMDEFQNIEKELGTVAAIVGLQFALESDSKLNEDKEIEWNQPVEEAPKDEAPKEEGEEEAAPKKPTFKVSDYKWSMSNRKPRNLVQIYMGSKGEECVKHEVKTAESYSTSAYEAVSKSLDEFCSLVKKEEEGTYLYTQVIFND